MLSTCGLLLQEKSPQLNNQNNQAQTDEKTSSVDPQPQNQDTGEDERDKDESKVLKIVLL